MTETRREKLATFAHGTVSRAILQAVTETGGMLIDRLVSDRHPDWGTIKDCTPADGLVAARAIEMHAHGRVREYLKACREAGIGWRKIGELLDLQADAKATERPVADCAFDVAAGPERQDGFSWDERSFTWKCKDCGEYIHDLGPGSYPEPGRRSHADGCKRLAVERRAHTEYEKERGW